MVKVGTVEYDVTLSRSKVQTELSAVSSDIERGMGASAAKVQSSFATAAKAAVAGFVALKGLSFAEGLVGGAVALSQQQQRANVVFGDSVKIVDDFGEHAAKSLGLSKLEAVKAASSYGILFHQFGIGTKASADMSDKLIQAAAAVARLNGADPNTVLDAFRSGLFGMGRPLRQYGIDLSAAALKQEAVREGLIGSKDSLTAAAKGQAAYALELKDSQQALDAFPGLAGSAAAQQQKLTAEWSDAKDKLGADLVPAMVDLEKVASGVLEVFSALPGPVQAGTVALGLSAVAYNTLGPLVKGIISLRGQQAEAELAAAGATEVDTGSSVAASEAFIAEQAAADELVAALQLVGASEEEVAIATGALVAVEGEAEIASVGLTAALGPLGIALAAAGVAYTAYKAITSGGRNFKVDSNAGTQLLHGTNAELLEFAKGVQKFGGEKGFEKLGEQSLPALKAVRAAVKGAHGDTTDLDTAIRNVTESNKRAADREARYGSTVDATGVATEKAAAAAKALKAIRDGYAAGALQDVGQARDLEAAKLAEVGTSDALTQAIKDEATARRAAAGDSDEYRAAEAKIAADKDAEAKASKSLADAERGLTDAREAARRSLRDERIETERSAISAERARLALADSRDALAKIQDDPRSTARQKEQALLDERDAELSLQDAQNKRGDSAADLAKAEKAGVDGAPGVLSAKQQVADAIKAQGDAEKQTALDTKAAAKVLTDAKDAEHAAYEKVRQAILDEAAAQEAIAEKAYGAAAGNDAYNASLIRSMALLDPNSPLVQQLKNYEADLANLAGYADLLNHNGTGPLLGLTGGTAGNSGIPTSGGAPRPVIVPPTTVPPTRDPDHGPRRVYNLNMRNGPTAAEIANEMAFGGH